MCLGTLDARVCDCGAVKVDGAQGVIVAGHDEIDVARAVIRIDDADDRDVEALGFLHRNRLLADVNNEDRVRLAIHLLDAFKRLRVLLDRASHARLFLLGQLFALIGTGEGIEILVVSVD